jgi:phosphoadenosine phosphosulfate reductase
VFDASPTQATAEVEEAGAGKALEQGLAELNRRYAPLGFEQRIRQIYLDFPPEKVLVTSSFAATSAYFLHIVSRIRPQQVIHFIDTGFHFPETLEYRAYLTRLFDLKVEDVRAEDWKHQFTVDDKTYERDPDLCCSINKVEPLDAVKAGFKLWVSSLMGWQSDHRAGLAIFEERRGIIKFNPMIDVSRHERDEYIRTHQLPLHPLVARGYSSIGCSHCTVAGEGRSGRWVGKPKVECGLHL